MPDPAPERGRLDYARQGLGGRDSSGHYLADANLIRADLFLANLAGADLDGATGLDTAMGPVDEPVLAVASSARCSTSTRASGVPAASLQSRIRYADTV